MAIAKRQRFWLEEVRNGPAWAHLRDSQKKELIKARLLLAAALDVYGMESAWLGDIEKRLASAGTATPVEAWALMTKLARIVKSCQEKRAWHEARDWPNFNTLHTIDALVAIDEAMKNTCNHQVTSEVYDDWVQTGEWIKEAWRNTYWERSDEDG